MNYEVLIVGGGVIGLSIARELYKKGARKIAVVERGLVGRESSWAAAGMLSPNIEAGIGSVFHRFCRESLEMYQPFAAELLNETGIDIELDRSGTIFVTFDDENAGKMVEEYAKLREAGVETEQLSSDGVLKTERHISPLVVSGLRFPGDWQADNRKLLSALRQYAESNSIELVENTAVDGLIVKDGLVCGTVAGEVEFLADKTVLATGAWSSHIKFGSEDTPFNIRPVRGQMIWFDCGERLLRKVVYGPHCYLVPRADGRILAGSTTEDVGFEKAVTESAIEHLRNAACEMLPLLREQEVAGSWSGLRPRSDDELPVIGEASGCEGLIVATGHYRNGILLAPITAKLIADRLIDAKESEYFEHFSPNRFVNEHKFVGA